MAHAPVSAPTANRMKIALTPVLTLPIAASRNCSDVYPARRPITSATSAASTSATWFGPLAPASPNR